MAELSDRPHDELVLVRRLDVPRELLVDLQAVGTDLSQRAERAVPGAEVVDRETHAKLPKSPDREFDPFWIAGDRPLGDFEFQPVRRKSGLLQTTQDQ